MVASLKMLSMAWLLSTGAWAINGSFSVWPQPARFDFDVSILARLDPSNFELRFAGSQEDSDLFQQAFERYRGHMFDTPGASSSCGVRCVSGVEDCTRSGCAEFVALPVIRQFAVQVGAPSPDLALGVNESYSLHIGVESEVAVLSAETVWGALRGLETFSQLVSEELVLGGKVHVWDNPRFAWRGLLVDTARHFIPVSVLEQVVEGISFQKMNVLHWHITDAQSFPLQTEAFPELSRQGAYRYPEATYSRTDVAGLVSFARARGVRVVLEVGTPGHAASWGKGYPELTAKCPQFHAALTSQLDRIPLDISKDLAYEAVEAVLNETTAFAPDAFVHLGGDEVQFGCWNESAGFADWMRSKGYATFEEAEASFVAQTLSYAKAGGRRGVVWQESFDHSMAIKNPSLSLSLDAVVQIWNDRSSLPKAIERGHDVLVSEGWYMDLQSPGIARGRIQDSWMDFYNTDALDGAEAVDPKLVSRHVLGGEAAMWSEEIDSANLVSTIFPRSAAAAERLHTPLDRIGDPNKAGDPSISQLQLANEVTQRLEVFRCILWRRGIRAGPVSWPSFCAASLGEGRPAFLSAVLPPAETVGDHRFLGLAFRFALAASSFVAGGAVTAAWMNRRARKTSVAGNLLQEPRSRHVELA